MQGLLPHHGHAGMGVDGEEVFSVLVTSGLQPSRNPYTRDNVCPVDTAWPCLGIEFQFGRVSKW